MPFVIVAYERMSGDLPFETFRAALGLKHRHQIHTAVTKLKESGSHETAAIQLTKQVGNVLELRRPADFRVYFFWDSRYQHYVMLNGHRKQRESTPMTSGTRSAYELSMKIGY